MYGYSIDRPELGQRAALHGALSDPIRLRIVDLLTVADLSPGELHDQLDVETNLLAHHLDTLEEAGLIDRVRSSGDGRRRYVRLLGDSVPYGPIPFPVAERDPVFVSTTDSARSPLAAAVWADLIGGHPSSAGTDPGARLHRRTRRAAERHGLRLVQNLPRPLPERPPHPFIISVCDRAHELMERDAPSLHWSTTDPTERDTDSAFDDLVADLRHRITRLSQGAPT